MTGTPTADPFSLLNATFSERRSATQIFAKSDLAPNALAEWDTFHASLPDRTQTTQTSEFDSYLDDALTLHRSPNSKTASSPDTVTSTPSPLPNRGPVSVALSSEPQPDSNTTETSSDVLAAFFGAHVSSEIVSRTSTPISTIFSSGSDATSTSEHPTTSSVSSKMRVDNLRSIVRRLKPQASRRDSDARAPPAPPSATPDVLQTTIDASKGSSKKQRREELAKELVRREKEAKSQKDQDSVKRRPRRRSSTVVNTKEHPISELEMPIVQAGSKAKILVTGVSGYVAVWVARVLLDRGHDVVGTVRSDAKGKEVAAVFDKLGYPNGRFRWVIVEDIAQEGAFDEAVKGVDAIAHVASPFHYNAVDPQELIKPAVDGTVGILESTRKFGQVKFLLRGDTPSYAYASFFIFSPDPLVLDESSWADQAVQEVEEKGKDAPAAIKYRASKTLAERAVWKFCETYKGSLTFDVTALNPSMVYGPEGGLLTSPSSLGTSAGQWHKTLTTTDPDATGMSPEALSVKAMSWIDVRDLAEAHARAFEREEAGGERIIIAYGPSSWQQWLDAANALNETSRPLAKGTPGLGADLPAKVAYITTKAEKILGISHNAPLDRPSNGEGLFKYHSLEETTKDTLKDFEQRGWW
ncbi:hypothetical protein VNI00_002647 [Paramarasmius palmivorus]|uniref:NAD-dependent epimerase/dehydratase domain-containing protein n=1 Tax=Paramarasmius palmivorus TaxID=297713 RepID=A0AAW0DZV1_9AGAR